MKFLKQKNISKFSISDQTLFTNQYGRAVMNLTGGLRLPQGTTDQRPQVTDVRIPGGTDRADGFIRYNTSIDPLTGRQVGIEAYIDGVWEVVRAPGETTIYKQTLGPGNDAEIFFGPLDKIPSSANNILVLVENVFQISDTNYTLAQNPPGLALATYGDVVEGQPYPEGWYLEFTSPVPSTGETGDSVMITVLYGYAN